MVRVSTMVEWERNLMESDSQGFAFSIDGMRDLREVTNVLA